MKVKVRISATQELRYSEVVDMEEAEFSKYDAMIDEDAERASEESLFM